MWLPRRTELVYNTSQFDFHVEGRQPIGSEPIGPIGASFCICAAYLAAFHSSCDSHDYSTARHGASPASIAFVVEAVFSGQISNGLPPARLEHRASPLHSDCQQPAFNIFSIPEVAGLPDNLAYPSQLILSPVRRLLDSLQQQNTWHQSAEEDPLSFSTIS
jgi:hypothetical protein